MLEIPRKFFTRGSTMAMPMRHFRVHPHLHCEKHEHGAKTNDAWHCWVFISEQIGKTWVVEGLKSCRKQLESVSN